MSASQALDVVRRNGTRRQVDEALYYITYGRLEPLLKLATRTDVYGR